LFGSGLHEHKDRSFMGTDFDSKELTEEEAFFLPRRHHTRPAKYIVTTLKDSVRLRRNFGSLLLSSESQAGRKRKSSDLSPHSESLDEDEDDGGGDSYEDNPYVNKEDWSEGEGEEKEEEEEKVASISQSAAQSLQQPHLITLDKSQFQEKEVPIVPEKDYQSDKGKYPEYVIIRLTAKNGTKGYACCCCTYQADSSSKIKLHIRQHSGNSFW